MKVCWTSGIAPIVASLLVLSLSSCDNEQRERAGFSISLTESGERILTDEHIAAYVWVDHRILLSPRGVERWESFVEFDKSQDPPIRKLGRLTTKEFVVILNGIQMYRGHFSSMVSSLAGSGVLLYDTLGAPQGEVWMTFARLDGAPEDDPRGHPDIEAYFRGRGKLKESR
jgi:hypothetical protein